VLILPAIDLRGGKCVRLIQGDYSRETVYSDDPVDVARQFSDQGAEWIHLVDLDAARSGIPTNFGILERLHESGVNLRIEFGGGMRSIETIQTALDAGADRVVVGSSLTKSDGFAAECFEFGDRVVAGIDTRDGQVAVDGWERGTSLSGKALAIRMERLGCKRIIWTDIATDGMLAGPNLDGLADLISKISIPLIASGGVSSLADLRAIAAIGSEGAIVGKAIYENRINLAEAIAACK
jgi:phosphoribosylformimino-5-aminoimidazole carboxamide ribotide isomerase